MENTNVEIKIAVDVIAVIAGLAATEVDGVAALSGNMTHDMIAKQNAKGLSKGVSLDVKNKNVDVKLSLVIKYGFDVKNVSVKVQEKVKNSIENMTGYTVNSVNINISGMEA